MYYFENYKIGENKMKTKEYIITAIMLAMGLILHGVIPAIFFGMKPDLLIIFLVLAILLTPTLSNTMVAGLGAGILSAMTTSFPGGQIPNVVDKITTALVVFILVKILLFIKNDIIKSAIIMGISTIISGSVFLYTASVLVGLPGGTSFTALFVSVVIPAFIANLVVGTIVYKSASIATRGKMTI